MWLIEWLRALLNGESKTQKMVQTAINEIRRTRTQLEEQIMALRDDLDQAEADIESALSDLATRISNLPDNAGDITQADVDDLKSVASRLNALAPSVAPADDGL